jgi:hypothetical protein
VSQISPPIRIVLAAAAIFLVAWMTVLRPKSAAEPAVTAIATPAGNVANGTPAVSGPGKLAEKAKAAADNSAAHQEQNAGEDTATGGTTATGTATGSTTGTATTTPKAPATAVADAQTAGLPKPVARAIEANKALVLLFFNPKAGVDRQVKHSLAKVDRWNGRVFVKAVPVAKVGRYARITGGAQVAQTPSVVVVDRDLKATTLPGFVDAPSIDQIVVDALRDSGGLFTSVYMRDVNQTCVGHDSSYLAVPEPDQPSATHGYVQRHAREYSAFAADLRSLKAPKRYTAFRKATIADSAAMATLLQDWSKALGTHPSAAKSASVGATFVKKSTPISKRMDKRFKANHVLACTV